MLRAHLRLVGLVEYLLLLKLTTRLHVDDKTKISQQIQIVT